MSDKFHWAPDDFWADTPTMTEPKPDPLLETAKRLEEEMRLDTEPLTAEQVAKQQDELGRKFEVGDLTNELIRAAMAYIPGWKGSFRFMESVQRQFSQRGTLSPAQVKGVLNSMAAEGRRKASEQKRQRQEQERQQAMRQYGKAVEQSVPNGYYTVVLGPDDYVTLRLSDDFRDDAPEGSQMIGVLIGPDSTHDYANWGFVLGMDVLPWKQAKSWKLDHPLNVSQRWVDAAKVLLAGAFDKGEAALQYAMRSNRCARCGRTLTVPASIHRGFGPECATKIGW